MYVNKFFLTGVNFRFLLTRADKNENINKSMDNTSTKLINSREIFVEVVPDLLGSGAP